MPDEKRRHPRHAIAFQLTGTALSPLGAGTARQFGAVHDVRGEVPNISAGGLCLLTDDKIGVSDALRCEIQIPSLPIGIPALLNVRWLCAEGGRYTYRLGLQFLV